MTSITTPLGILSYPKSLYDPQANKSFSNNQDKLYYSAELLFPKTIEDMHIPQMYIAKGASNPVLPNFNSIIEAQGKAVISEWGSTKTIKNGIEKESPNYPSNFKSPIRDGDEKLNSIVNLDKKEEASKIYAGQVFITVKNLKKPQIVDSKLNPISKEDLPKIVIPGAVARVSFAPVAFNVSGNVGVTFQLKNVQVFEQLSINFMDTTPEEDFNFDPFEQQPQQQIAQQPQQQIAQQPPSNSFLS